ncbi:uncharacterized protein LOC110813346 [Carica papaya]|uniref:uncharacterized protein LOC110813346 n=1 Tax=Carica papaya TaxID=3649 RepID=UPI000B8CC12A|nr:uncharacterized protein LOC110813346 [Carica papaya]
MGMKKSEKGSGKYRTSSLFIKPSSSVFPGRNSFETPGSSLAEIRTEKKRLKEFLLTGDFDDDDDDDNKSSSKPFWQFKRSSSLNCERIRTRGLIRSLQFLSRSNSTGSVPIPKQTQTQKPNFQKQTRKSKSSVGNGYFMYSSSQKPPLKNGCGAYGNGVNGISPVLNFPPAPPFISNATERLFGFGSSLCNGKARKKKKS